MVKMKIFDVVHTYPLPTYDGKVAMGLKMYTKRMKRVFGEGEQENLPLHYARGA